MKQIILSLAAMCSAFAAPALASDAAPVQRTGVESRIPFVQSGTIRNWSADGDRAVFLQDAHANWYRATFMAPCRALKFADAIGVETRGDNALDKFGTIIVRGERCALTSLTASDGPPPKVKAKKATPAE